MVQQSRRISRVRISFSGARFCSANSLSKRLRSRALPRLLSSTVWLLRTHRLKCRLLRKRQRRARLPSRWLSSRLPVRLAQCRLRRKGLLRVSMQNFCRVVISATLGANWLPALSAPQILSAGLRTSLHCSSSMPSSVAPPACRKGSPLKCRRLPAPNRHNHHKLLKALRVSNRCRPIPSRARPSRLSRPSSRFPRRLPFRLPSVG